MKIRFFNDDQVVNIVGVPKGRLPIAILPRGYPAQKPIKASRRSREDVVTFMDQNEPNNNDNSYINDVCVTVPQ